MSTGASTAAPDTGSRTGALLVAVYITLVPLLGGVARGTGVPLLRPSEALQVGLTGVGVTIAAMAIMRGDRWRVVLRPLERWLLAVLVLSTIVPLLWLIARGQPVDGDALLAVFPFVKLVALFGFARVSIRTPQDVKVVVGGVIVGATALSIVVFAQALDLGPTRAILGQYFVSGADTDVDAGRATATLGSAIATGSYLAMATGLALSLALSTRRSRWLLVATILGMATMATGQAGAVIALAILVLVLAAFHQRLLQVVALAIPIGALAVIGLWPIVAARLEDIDQQSGLPGSWIIRWVNVTELYLPSLMDGGWLLGVSPEVAKAPPDVWRDIVYLESGYLWFLWVGGIPLFVAGVGFLFTAWRQLQSAPATPGTPLDAARLSARAAVSMMAILSVIDPYLTLRASGDLFFVVLAVGCAGWPAVVSEPAQHRTWQHLLGAERHLPWSARLQMAETDEAEVAWSEDANGLAPEGALVLSARGVVGHHGSAILGLERRGAALHGVVAKPVIAAGPGSAALVWRAIVLCAASLRLESLSTAPTVTPSGIIGAPAPLGDRAGVRTAAGLARQLESRRSASADTGDPTSFGSEPPDPHLDEDGAERPVRLVLDTRIPTWKRSADIVLALVGLVVSAPIWLICAAWVRLSSPGPALFRQVRVGEGGLPFQLLKFRTMYVNNSDAAHREQNRKELLEGAPAEKQDDDVRIAPGGRLLRRLSLDELPQLCNVLRGEMSIVGPRPSLLWEVELFPPSKRRRLQVRPGITGLWQVTGRADVSMAEMLDLDLFYVDEMGPRLDAKCLAGTARSVVSGRGAK